MLDHTKPCVEKIHYIVAEQAGHAHKLDVKLQSLCGSSFSLFAVRILAKSYHFGVNWPTTLRKNTDGVNFFTLIFEYHNRYNKLLLCNFLKMVRLHDAVKIIENGVFVIFLKKEQARVLIYFTMFTVEKQNWRKYSVTIFLLNFMGFYDMTFFICFQLWYFACILYNMIHSFRPNNFFTNF